MPQFIPAAIAALTPALGATAAKVVVYGSLALATGYATYKVAENKMKRMEAEARRKARNRAVEVQNLQFGTTASRRFIYGETLTNGHLVFQETAGTDNKDLYRVVYLGEGPIQEASQVFFDEEGKTHGNLDVNAGTAITDSPYNNYNKVQVFLDGGLQNGSSGSAAADLIANTTWSNTDKMTDNATFVYKLVHNNEVWTNGIPNIRVKVKGRKLYDPRLDGSITGGSGTHRVNNESTWAYSNNPALCILDFLLNGMDVDADSIDMQTFQTAADTCDDNVNILDSDGNSTTEKRYAMNGVVFLEEEVIGVLEQMLATCHGTLIEEAGTVRLIVPGDATTVAVSLNEDDYISDLSISVNTAFDKRINSVSGTFTDPNADYLEGDFGVIESSSLIAEDGRTHKQSIALPYVTSESQAQRLASIALKENALSLAVAVTLKPEFAYLRVGDIVTMRFAPDLIGGTDSDEVISTSTKFMVTQWTMNVDTSITVELQEYSDASYNWNTGDHNYITRTAPADSFIEGVPQPALGTTAQFNTLDAQGREVVGFIQPITHASHPNFSHTHLELQVKDGSSWRAVETKEITSGNAVFQNIPPKSSANADLEYRLLAKTILINGYVSPQTIKSGTAFNNQIAYDTTAPSAVSLTATGGYRTVNLAWTVPSVIDFDHVRIFRNTTNNSSTATEIGRETGPTFTDSGLNDSTTYYYWAKSYDQVGNASAFSGTAASATTLAQLVDGADGAENRHLDLQTTSGASLDDAQQRISISSSNTSWDQAVHSNTSYTGGAQLTFGVSQTNKKIMMGLNTDPANNASYTTIDYAWYANVSGISQIYENGTSIGSQGTYTADSVFTITYDDDKIRYYLDGVLKRTVDVSSGLEFYLDSSFRDNGTNQTRFFNFTPMGSKGATGLTGASTNIIFQRSATAPSAPAASSGVPTGWYDSPPTGTDLLWASSGTRAAGGTNFTWATPFRIEGEAVAEVAIYRKGSDAGASGGSYDFTTNTLTAPTDWSTDPQALSADGDTVYRATGIATGAATATAATVTYGTPVVYAKRTDGASSVEVYVYRRNDNTTPGSGTYNFSTGSLTVPSGWSSTIPSAGDNGDTIYRVRGRATGQPTDTAVTVSWSTPETFSVNRDQIYGEIAINDYYSPSNVPSPFIVNLSTTMAAGQGDYAFLNGVSALTFTSSTFTTTGSVTFANNTHTMSGFTPTHVIVREATELSNTSTDYRALGSVGVGSHITYHGTNSSSMTLRVTSVVKRLYLSPYMYHFYAVSKEGSSGTGNFVTQGTPTTLELNTQLRGNDGADGPQGDRGPGRWHIPVSSLPTTPAAAQSAWGSPAPSTPIASDQAWFYTGTQANPTGQAVFIYNGTTWVEQDEVIDGNLLVTGTVSTAQLDADAVTAEKIQVSKNTTNIYSTAPTSTSAGTVSQGASGMFFNGIHNRIEIWDSGVLRVLLGDTSYVPSNNP